MPPPRAPKIRLRLRNALFSQKGAHGRRKSLQVGQQQQHQQQQPQQQQPRAGGSANRPQRKPWQRMWVSTNKVLIGSVGGLKKTHFRNPNFECDETKLLISLWGDPQVQRTLITTHKKHPVIAKLAEKMREYGYNRSTEEINTRIKNLKCFYNRIKKDLETGVINEASWKHYHAMDEILTRPVFGGASHSASTSTQSGDAGRSGMGIARRGNRNSDASNGPELSEDPEDQIEVKLELVSDDDKELRAEDLLKNAEQVELKEPNLLIPKDEPMEDDEDDPNDPDFEHDGGSETDDESSGMDEADDSERSTRLRRRKKRVHKSGKSHPSSGGASTASVVSDKSQAAVITPTAVTSAPSLPGTIKIMNYGGGSFLKFTSVSSVGGLASTTTSTVGITTIAGNSGAVTTTPSSKISLVPTNFLLKSQTSTMGFKQPIQLYTKPTVSIAGTKPTTGLQPVVSMGGTTVTATGSGTPGGPMKLLLVNTLPKDGSAPKQQLITQSAKHIYTTSTGVPLQQVSGIPPLTMQPKQLVAKPAIAALAGKLVPSATVTPKAAASSGGPPKLGGFKALLNQMVSLQREDLGVSKTRLLAEKERMSHEKSVANSLLEALGELNALLTEANAELHGEAKESEEMHIQISNVRHVPSLNRCYGRQKEARHVLQPVIDDDNVKPEVISDSEDG